jgi:hypothetical protein
MQRALQPVQYGYDTTIKMRVSDSFMNVFTPDAEGTMKGNSSSVQTMAANENAYSSNFKSETSGRHMKMQSKVRDDERCPNSCASVSMM